MFRQNWCPKSMRRGARRGCLCVGEIGSPAAPGRTGAPPPGLPKVGFPPMVPWPALASPVAPYGSFRHGGLVFLLFPPLALVLGLVLVLVVLFGWRCLGLAQS